MPRASKPEIKSTPFVADGVLARLYPRDARPDDAFEAARRRAQESLDTQNRSGIGRMGEKLVHATLKFYIEPREMCHEVPVGRYIADIKNQDGITEVQTGGLSSMKAKLECFLDFCPVTVVYPAIARKYLSWVEPETGECSAPRKSPKEGCGMELLRELYGLRHMLNHKGLTIRLLLLDVVEYRSLNGWSADRKKGSERCDRFPLCLRRDITFTRPDDYAALLPDGLADGFTSRQFADAARITRHQAGWILPVLREAGVIIQTGKLGNSAVYRAISSS